MKEEAKGMFRRHLLAGAAGLAMLTALPATAQDMMAQATDGDNVLRLEEIVVTAQRRQENLQQVPIAVTAITADTLAEVGITNTTLLPQTVPSLQMSRSGPSGIFFVRGVGNTSGGTGEEGANAFYVDGVFLSNLNQSVLKFNNIERIEVLRGPQGTLFGRNASGGLVNVITRDPGDQLVIKGQAGIANYQTYSGQLYVAGPVSDTLSADIALSGSDQKDGWGRNIATGKEVGQGWNWGLRSKWLWRPTENTRLTFAGEYGKQDEDFSSLFALAPESVGTGGTRRPAGRYDTNTVNPQYAAQRTYGLSLTSEFDLDWATLTSITAFRGNKTSSALDPDGGPLPLFANILSTNGKSFQEELRLASETDGPLSWQTGLFFLRTVASVDPFASRGTALGGANAGNDIFASMTTHSYAVFGEATYAILPSTFLTGGIRYTHDDRTLEGRQVSVGLPTVTTQTRNASQSYGEFTYRASLRHEFSDSFNVYASYNRGFKSGLFSLTSLFIDPVTPQTIDAYEIGSKAELFDHRLRLNLSAFTYKIHDYQVRAATGVGATAVLLNAAAVKNQGLEAEFDLIVADGLNLFGSFTVLDSKFSSFPFAPYTYPNPSVCNPAGAVPPGQVTPGTPTGGARSCIGSAKGNRTPVAPEFVASLGTSYSFPVGNEGTMRLSALYNYNDGYFFEVDNRLRQDSYSTLNLSVEYSPVEQWSVELWAQNATNEKYYVQKLGSALGDLAVSAAPRQYGLNLKYEF